MRALSLARVVRLAGGLIFTTPALLLKITLLWYYRFRSCIHAIVLFVLLLFSCVVLIVRLSIQIPYENRQLHYWFSIFKTRNSHSNDNDNVSCSFSVYCQAIQMKFPFAWLLFLSFFLSLFLDIYFLNVRSLTHTHCIYLYLFFHFSSVCCLFVYFYFVLYLLYECNYWLW